MNSKEFGEALKKKRQEIGLTQSELAKRCGTGERFIVDLEAGKPTSQLGKALMVATELGFDFNSVDKPEEKEAEDVDLGWMPNF